MDDHSDLAQALDYIDPSTLDYQDWVNVGMAIHESGLPMELWDAWSQRDYRRYHEGECASKWKGFGHGMDRVRSGTVVTMAKANGWVPRGADEETDCATGCCTCGNCGEPIDPWDEWCRHCGAELED